MPVVKVSTRSALARGCWTLRAALASASRSNLAGWADAAVSLISHLQHVDPHVRAARIADWYWFANPIGAAPGSRRSHSLASHGMEDSAVRRGAIDPSRTSRAPP